MSAPSTPSAEDAEWAEELARSWVEVYKKSATTLALLRIIRRHGPLAAAGISPRFTETTGWTLTDRGLYRTLRRLADSGVLTSAKVEVARTGAKRQDFSLTPVGRAYLERIERELV
ncbi:MAG: PadR family transcriptional regulator [Brachybacterium sp.]|nr:PadR family transcriptional regulator [Brachybacterium sp.]MDN6400039.1 PadR family transcriptional regulator [Brachybacterium sp.]